MKASYDFRKGTRGRIVHGDDAATSAGGKAKITIRLDQDVVDHFMAKSDQAGGTVGYQTLINDALRRSIDSPSLEAMVRRAIRDELRVRPSAA